MTTSYCVLDTAIGHVAFAWTEAGVCAVALPNATHERTVEALLEKCGEAVLRTPAGPMKTFADRLAKHVSGSPQDLSFVELDLGRVPPFHRRVYQAARRLRAGEVATYGDLARAAGSPAASRAVGQAMAKNPFPLVVPCHRVLASGRKVGGFSAPGGLSTKRRLLALEGVHVSG